MSPPVSAVILAFNRLRAVNRVIDELEAQGVVDEIIVVDTGTDGTAAAVRERGIEAFEPGDVGVAGRNVGAEAATHDLILMLDDDSFPVPGSVEFLVGAMEANPRLAVATGLIRDTTWEGEVLQATHPGSFDWFLRAGRTGDPPEGFEVFFFAEGGCLARRRAFLDAGGFFAPYFFTQSEIDATMRIAAAGWEVRYFPQAAFDHLKATEGRARYDRTLRLRIRNQLWHFWLRYPPAMAVPRIAGYLAFDLVECTYRGHPGVWASAIGDAWRERGTVAPYRRPLPRDVIRHVERNRGRMHLELLWAQLRRRLPLSS